MVWGEMLYNILVWMTGMGSWMRFGLKGGLAGEWDVLEEMHVPGP